MPPDLVAPAAEPVSRTPVWFMRQAGRSLPEYRAARGDGLHPLRHRRRRAVGRADPAAGAALRRRRRHPVLRHRRAPARHRLRRRRGAGPRARWWPSPSAATADLARLRPFEPASRRALRGRDGPPGPPGAGGLGVALIGFAGAPFTVASYLVEGGPSRTFAKVKALMHGDPGLWQQLTDRLAAMAVASLRAQIEAGAQAVQLFDSWAGSLSPAEYARFALPATRAVLAGIADLGVPTILFGVGTGELLGLMGSAGIRRGRRRLARPARRGAPARRRRARAAGQPRPRALPGAVARRRGGHPGRPRRRRRRHRHRPRLQPRPRRPARDRTRASWPPSSTWSTRRPRGHDDGRPGHGARHAGEHGGDRPLLHAHPPRPPARARAAGRARRAATRAIGGVSPLADRTAAQVDARARRARGARARATTSCRSAPSTPTRSSRRPPRRLGAAGLERVIGLVLTPHGSSLGSQEYLDRAAAALGATPVRARRRRGTPSRRWSRCSPPACGTRCGTVAGPGHGRSSPRTRCPSASGRPATPTPSSWPSRPAWSPPRPGSTTGSWPGRARDGPPSPGSVPTSATSCASLAADGEADAVVVCPDRVRGRPPRGALRPRRRAGRPSPRRAASPTRAPHRSTTTPPSSPRWPI